MQRLFIILFSILISAPVALGAIDEAALKARMEAAIQKHGGEPFRQLRENGYRLKLEITRQHGGKSYATTTLYQKGDRSRTEIEQGGEIEIQGFDGQIGWRKQGFLVTRLAQEENEERRDALLQDFFAIPRILAICSVESGEDARMPDGRNAYKITFKLPSSQPTTGGQEDRRTGRIDCYLDSENRIVGLEYTTLDRETYETSRVVEAYHNFRQVGDLLIPFEQRIFSGGTHVATAHIVELDPKAAIEDRLFERPPSDQPPIVTDKLPCKVPFELVRSSIYLEVSINDSKPHLIILDTGASRSWIDTKVAKEMGVEEIPDTDHLLALVYGLVPAKGMRAKSVRIGDAEIKEVVFSVGPLAGTPLGDDEINGKPIIGLLGREVISAFQTTIDFANRTITLEPPNASAPNGTVIPFDLYGDHILVTTRVSDKQDVRMIVDTGAATNLVPPAFKMDSSQGKFMNLEQWYKRMGEFFEKDAYDFMTGDMRVLRLNSMSLGNLRFEPVFAFQKTAENARQDTIFGSKTTHGLLGIPIMRHFKITFNYFREQMIWQRLSGEEQAADNAGYGIWWRKGSKGLFIEWVMPLSDADLAGLQKGDRILTIDGLPADKMNEDQLVNRLSYTKPGRKVKLVIERARKRLEFNLTARTYEI